MSKQSFLYMMLLGCKPEGRLIEQHDIYFAIGSNLKEAAKDVVNAWPEANGDIHIDAWRKVTKVGNYSITIEEGIDEAGKKQDLFFVNLGGYQPQEFEERHFKVMVVAESTAKAKQLVKSESFFSTHIHSHVDDQFAIDVDDIFSVPELLSNKSSRLKIIINDANENATEDLISNGYFQLHLLKEKW